MTGRKLNSLEYDLRIVQQQPVCSHIASSNFTLDTQQLEETVMCKYQKQPDLNFKPEC